MTSRHMVKRVDGGKVRNHWNLINFYCAKHSLNYYNYQLMLTDPHAAASHPINHCAVHRPGRHVWLTGNSHRSMQTTSAYVCHHHQVLSMAVAYIALSMAKFSKSEFGLKFQREAPLFLEIPYNNDNNNNNNNNTCLVALCTGLPGWAGTRKIKKIWIYWGKRYWEAVASEQLYANLHLAPDR